MSCTLDSFSSFGMQIRLVKPHRRSAVDLRLNCCSPLWIKRPTLLATYSLMPTHDNWKCITKQISSIQLLKKAIGCTVSHISFIGLSLISVAKEQLAPAYLIGDIQYNN